jgi:hypothetical protein
VASLVYLTTRAPSKFAEELMLAGHQVHEALAVSEALYLCEQGPVDVIVIAPDVEDPDLVEAQLHHITIRMKPEGTAKELVWELSQLFPQQPGTIQ